MPNCETKRDDTTCTRMLQQQMLACGRSRVLIPHISESGSSGFFSRGGGRSPDFNIICKKSYPTCTVISPSLTPSPSGQRAASCSTSESACVASRCVSSDLCDAIQSAVFLIVGTDYQFESTASGHDRLQSLKLSGRRQLYLAVVDLLLHCH